MDGRNLQPLHQTIAEVIAWDCRGLQRPRAGAQVNTGKHGRYPGREGLSRGITWSNSGKEQEDGVAEAFRHIRIPYSKAWRWAIGQPAPKQERGGTAVGEFTWELQLPYRTGETAGSSKDIRGSNSGLRGAALGPSCCTS